MLHLDRSAGEVLQCHRPGIPQRPGNRPTRQIVRTDQPVDPQVCLVVDSSGAEVRAVVDTGQAFSRAQSLGHRRRQQVDLIAVGGRQEQVARGPAGLGDDLGVGAVAAQTADVERVLQLPQFVSRKIDHRDVVAGGSEDLGGMSSHFAGTGNDYIHEGNPTTKSAQRA